MAIKKPASSAKFVSNYFSEVWFCEMIYYFYIIFHFLLATCCQNNSASEEETEVVDKCEFPDFTPFVARFRSYKRDLSEANKVILMPKGWKI